MSLASYRSSIERAHHHEVSVSQKEGKGTVQVAVYSDRVADPALTGVGETSHRGGSVLPDLYSGTFTYQGSDLETHGVRVLAQRKISSTSTASVDYDYGGVLDLDKEDVQLQDARDWMSVRNRHQRRGKDERHAAPHQDHVGSPLIAGLTGQALTPVDSFNASPGQSDPFLNFFLRQPIPGFLSGHVDALVDVRNLLAQGYVPVMGQDGRTVYLVQSARAVRGGLAFTF